MNLQKMRVTVNYLGYLKVKTTEKRRVNSKY
jgi:hypothetical protein